MNTNGFIKHRIYREQNHERLTESFAKQTKENDYFKFCRQQHMIELESKQGVQGNMFRAEKLYKELINQTQEDKQ